MIRELVPNEFDGPLLPVLTCTFSRFQDRREFSFPGSFNPDHFFAEWRNLMNLGMARTWVWQEELGAPIRTILGGLIVPDLFTGIKNGSVVFWGKMDGGKGAERLLSVFEDACRQAGCRAVYAAAIDNIYRDQMRTKYRSRGYRRAEEIFVKIL